MSQRDLTAMDALTVSANDFGLHDDNEETIAAWALLALRQDDNFAALSRARISPPIQRLLSRNTGYGDFCLGREPITGIPKWQEFSGRDCRTDEESRGVQTESSGTLIPEFGDFKRTGPFPFFNLPLEIRRKILTMVVGALFRYDTHTKKPVLRITLLKKDLDFEPGLTWIDELESYLAKSASFMLGTGRLLNATSQYWQLEEILYHHQARLFHRNLQVHPERSYLYLIDAEVEMLRLNPKRIDTDWLMIDLVRRLSNVSTQLRHELGSVIWRNTHLEVDGSDFAQTSESLLAFLEERPAIHQGIKSIHIKLNCIDQGFYNLAHITRWCQYMANKLELATLYIELIGERSDIEEMVLGGGPLCDLLSIRNLNVTSEFRFKLYVCVEAMRGEGMDEPGYLEHLVSLQTKLQEPLRQVIMPDTLRTSQATTHTQVEDYMDARNVDPVSATTDGDDCATTLYDLIWGIHPDAWFRRHPVPPRVPNATGD